MNNVMGLICANYNTDKLGALTEERPLASVPFGGRYRLLDFVLSNMVNSGIRTVGVVTPYMYRSIMDHLGAGKDWLLDRKLGGLFVLPGSIYGFKNMSTQFLIKDMVKNKDYLLRDEKEYVIIATANQVYNMDYEAFAEAHMQSGADITLAYKTVDPKTWNDHGLFLDITEDGKVSKTHIGNPVTELSSSYPPALFIDCIIMSREKLIQLIKWYEAVDHLDLMEVIAENIGLLSVNSFEFTGYLGRINSIDSYLKCSMELLAPKIHEEVFFGSRPVYTKVKDGVPSRYIEHSHVSNSLIPNECTIRGRVENSVIFASVVINEDAIIKNSVIMQRCTIGKNAVIENVIADKFVSVGNGAVIMGSDDHPVVIKKKSVM